MRVTRTGLIMAVALVVAGSLSVGYKYLRADRPDEAKPTGGAVPGETPAKVDWKEADKLISEQKFQQALEVVQKIRAAAEKSGDEDNWTRALIREVQLRSGLHEYETSVRFLKEQAWPKGPKSRAVLNLFYAHLLVSYYQSYGWEINQREKVVSQGIVDLKSWTVEQIFDEAQKAYVEVWKERAKFGTEPVGALSEFIQQNNYPEGIRSTFRDAIGYLYSQLLSQQDLWTVEQKQDVYRLNLRALIESTAEPDSLLTDRASHPVVKIVWVLSDLESWHALAGRREASLESRLERLRVLHAVFAEEEDRALLKADLRGRLPDFRKYPWWAMGQAVLAQFIREETAPDALVRADAEARKGMEAYPDDVGGRQCLCIHESIVAPEYQLQCMSSDAAGKRSVLVLHKNFENLFFRAYKMNLEELIESAKDYNLLPQWREIDELLKTGRTAAEWAVQLPPTPDYREHKTYVTPPMTDPGLYVIVASARPGFGQERNKIEAVNIILTDLVLVTRNDADGGVEVMALRGSDGQPVESASVTLYRYDWQKGHLAVETRRTGKDGVASFRAVRRTDGSPLFLLGRSGSDIALDSSYLYLYERPASSASEAALVYTDRSVYRPLQKILWKVVAYRRSATGDRFETLPNRTVSIRLLDANNQEVDSKTAATGAAGSASGEFPVPPGRLLGQWRLVASPSGLAAIRVEEYKRPTFEVSVKEARVAVRLNKPATITGEARYYFGLPVVNGGVKYRVMREEVYPWWWMWWSSARAARTVAAGVAKLEPDGTFTMTFTPEVDERKAAVSKEITYRYTITADVTDEGGETRSASRSFMLGFVTVQARIDLATAFVREGEPGELTVTRSNLDGVPRAGSGRWRIVALRQPESALLPADQPITRAPGESEAVTTPGDLVRPRWDSQYNPEAVLRTWADGDEKSKGDVTHDENGRAVVRMPVLDPGAYRISYQTTDDDGVVCTASKEFIVAGSSLPLALPAVLIAEKSTVPAGGVARFLAHTGLRGQAYCFEIYRGGELKERRFLQSGRDASLIEIPVNGNDRGGFSVRLTLLRDHQFIQMSQPLFVPWDDKQLSVQFASFRDLLRPRARETWRVVVKGPGNSGAAAAELLAYMYDRSLDLFAPHSPPNPLSLYPNRAGAVSGRASLGFGNPVYAQDSCFACVSSCPPLIPDALRFYDSYAIGGPGRRGMGFAVAGAAPVEEPTVARQSVGSKEKSGKVAANGLEMDQAKDEKKTSAPTPAEPAGQQPELRSDFSETAFWQPHLITNPDGSAAFEFTVPDSITSWNVWVHAVTNDLKAGSIHCEARTVKDLMVRPYLPRFLREGDRAELKVVVNNASKGALKGAVTLDITDPETNQNLNVLFGLGAASSTRAFTVAAGGGSNVAFPIVAPTRVGPVAFKVTAVSGDFSDGELRSLPVLPGRLHLAQSRFVTLKGNDRREMVFEDMLKGGDPTRINEQLVVTVDAQLFYGVLSALPYLVNYPYECTEQTLNRFLSTGILSSLFSKYPAVARMALEMSKRETRFETWDSLDPNRKMGLEETPWLQEAKGGREAETDLLKVLDPRIARAQRDEALAKLAKAQTSIGAFPWWPGGPPSPYMTLYLLYGFSKGLEFHVEVPKEMVVRAWSYMHRHYIDELVQMMMAHDCCWEFVTFLNYVLSCYPDTSWTGGVFTDAERKQMLDFSFKHWKQHSPYSKCQLALTLHRMNRAADAKLVFDSVMDSSKTTRDEGTFWAPEDRAWLWYNDTIETHAFALRTLRELRPDDSRSDGLVQWLFLNKKLNHWKSTRATAEVIYSLAGYLDAAGALGVRERVAVDVCGQSTTWVFEPDVYTGKKNQLIVPGEKIDAQECATVTVSKDTPGFAFASSTWHFSTEELPAEARGDFFSVTRRYFRRENTGKGFELRPLEEGTAIHVGDEVEVQLSIRTKHPSEYVHLRDPRPAGFEPVTLKSGYRWDLGIVTYEEVRDSGENFFFENLPQGEYTFKYRLRASMTGHFKVSPATLQSMYAPEFTAYSAGDRIEIKQR
ncbi:MAG: alpha-2-macroglobulin family protein [Acidobacteriota bacterium]